MSAPLVIAIDGPAAAGKGTLARRLAGTLGLPYLDTGLLYRAVAARLLDAGDGPVDPQATQAARALDPDDLARTDLRRPDVDAAAAAIASLHGVREALLAFQRGFGHSNGAVLDGRDIGTVIFPNAPIKLFVTASLDARAGRRRAELAGRGISQSLEQVRAAIAARDEADAARVAAPLRPAEDAITLDTTQLDAEQAFQEAKTIIERQGLWR